MQLSTSTSARVALPAAEDGYATAMFFNNLNLGLRQYLSAEEAAEIVRERYGNKAKTNSAEEKAEQSLLPQNPSTAPAPHA